MPGWTPIEVRCHFGAATLTEAFVGQKRAQTPPGYDDSQGKPFRSMLCCWPTPMPEFTLRFLGVGNAHAPALGSSAAVLEASAEPWLLIDCGPDSLTAYVETYGGLPTAIFITHPHFDHIGGLEALFYRLATASGDPRPPRLYVPAALLPVLQGRLADYPNLLAEGGCNFWDVFHLIPVSERFWHRDLLFSVFPVRHHDYLGAFGLALEGHFLFTGDTRPIPEILNRFASRGELIFHDCGTHPNPSHTWVQDLAREYKPEQRRRLVLYHYASEDDGRVLEGRGYRIARRGEQVGLSYPLAGGLASWQVPRDPREIFLHPGFGPAPQAARQPDGQQGESEAWDDLIEAEESACQGLPDNHH